MATLIIRQIDDTLKDRIRARADRDGISLRAALVAALEQYAPALERPGCAPFADRPDNPKTDRALDRWRKDPR